jgi:hypothetical protein
VVSDHPVVVQGTDYSHKSCRYPDRGDHVGNGADSANLIGVRERKISAEAQESLSLLLMPERVSDVVIVEQEISFKDRRKVGVSEGAYCKYCQDDNHRPASGEEQVRS